MLFESNPSAAIWQRGGVDTGASAALSRGSSHHDCADSRYIQAQKSWLHVERLPAYAPELNPVEYLWANWRKHELANFCPKDVWQRSHAASQALKRIRRRRRRPQLITAFFHQAELF